MEQLSTLCIAGTGSSGNRVGVDGAGSREASAGRCGEDILSPRLAPKPGANLGHPTYGSGDNDAFTFDPNTGRFTSYQFNVGSPTKYDKGTVGWNPNGTLGQLAITDQLISADTQTCNYSHDDLVRIASASCGTPWSQTFTYDAFGNISKSGSISFQPGYSTSTNRYTSLPGLNYDSDGNPLNDSFYTYTWDANGRPVNIDSISYTYDALGRQVAQDASAHLEVVYSPGGSKLAVMDGQFLSQAFIPLPGGAKAVYGYSGLSYYRHPDWLGSSRLATTPSRTVYFDAAYAPYGEDYGDSGTTDLSFAGMDQTMITGLFDGMYREYHPRQGRWISPDPTGLGAVDPATPQTWNRYAYVGDSPLNRIDPSGLFIIVCIEGTTDCQTGDCDVSGDCLPLPIIPPGLGYGGEDNGVGGEDGGTIAPPRQRKGGVWPDNETLGLPGGLNIRPFSLADLLGLSPGTECEFGVCLPIGNDFVSGVTGAGAGDALFKIDVLVLARFLAANNCQAPFLCNSTATIGPPPQPKPGPTGLKKYLTQYVPCAVGEGINQFWGDDDTAAATVLANIAPLAPANLLKGGPFVYLAITAGYDFSKAFQVRQTCTQSVYGGG